ncbi:hypothetical protein [Gorillibacterium timonense]|uniref:hypothetical protein n=1 Tax=Gorillibacterium timonense TaxID=1689269 RepID=UPI00071DF397|nr:hypothetical protein [Gorillibacterium timonense]
MNRIATAVSRTALLLTAALMIAAASGTVSVPGAAAAAPDPTGSSGAESPVPIHGATVDARASSTATLEPFPSESERKREERISAWIEELSRQPGFESWKNADHRTEVLGPGTHSWLVTIIQDNKETGYLVATYSPDGELGLAEYGNGPYPLFSMTTLHRILAQRGLVLLSDSSDVLHKNYLGPLESYWIVETGEEPLYLDAKSGERLPELTAPLLPLLSQADDEASLSLLSGAKLIKTEWHSSESPSDPLDDSGWMKPDAHAKHFANAEALLPILSKQPVNLSFVLYGGQCIYPFAVSGLHLWTDGTAYVSVDQDGSRFIPWTAAAQGSFSLPSL